MDVGAISRDCVDGGLHGDLRNLSLVLLRDKQKMKARVRLTESSLSAPRLATLAHGRIGTLIPKGALRVSRSKSGKCIKSKVLESPTDFRLLDVLKRRTLLPVSVASGTGMVCSPWRRMGPAGRFEAYGLSVVRSDEEEVEPVIDS